MRTVCLYSIMWIGLALLGLGLMIFKIAVDSEPGAIPLGLILLGVGGYVINRWRARNKR